MLEPYGLYDFDGDGGGADIGPLGEQGVPLIGLSPDSQRYFDYHHTANDTLDKINAKDLDQQVAAYAVLAYLAAETDKDIRPEPPKAEK